jgi:ABC-2 type transport system ATP-binding protein
MDAAVEPVDVTAVATAALELRGVVKSWGDQPVLREVDLDLPPGTVVAIAGRNGAGKTTLLRVASGLIVPERGTVRLDGLDPERDRTEFQSRLGYLSAGNSGLYARLKAEHHLELAAKLALMPRRERKPAIERALQAFELEKLCGRRVDRLSMGQRQRLRLALSFVHQPSVVLLDEPSTSLDQDGRALVQQALNDLKARGGAAIVCVPTGGEPLPVVDRVLELSEGRLL